MKKEVLKVMADCTRNELARRITDIEQYELDYRTTGKELIEIKQLWNNNKPLNNHSFLELEIIGNYLVYANKIALNLLVDLRNK